MSRGPLLKGVPVAITHRSEDWPQSAAPMPQKETTLRRKWASSMTSVRIVGAGPPLW